MGLKNATFSETEYYDHLSQSEKTTGSALPRRRGVRMEEQKIEFRRNKYMELKKTLITRRSERQLCCLNYKTRIREIIINKN